VNKDACAGYDGIKSIYAVLRRPEENWCSICDPSIFFPIYRGNNSILGNLCPQKEARMPKSKYPSTPCRPLTYTIERKKKRKKRERDVVLSNKSIEQWA
jgi:hypothetical protein